MATNDEAVAIKKTKKLKHHREVATSDDLTSSSSSSSSTTVANSIKKKVAASTAAAAVATAATGKSAVISGSTVVANAAKQKSQFGAKLVCGAIAGVVGTCVIFPMDTVKTQLMTQKPGPDGVRPYKHALDCAVKIYRGEGARGFYKGLGPNLVGVIPEKALKLAVNHELQELLKGDGELTLPKQIVAGAGAGFCQVVATTPMERVKIVLQMARHDPNPARRNITAWQAVREMGVGRNGLYKGLAATLIRDVPFSFIYFPLYQQLKDHYMPPGAPHTFALNMKSSVIAGAIAAAAVTPCDVIKTRLQSPTGTSYQGFADCYRRILAEEGPLALFRGVTARVCIISPLFGIAMTVYEVQQKYFN